MNVNGSRFHLLFGPTDWKNCLSDAEDQATLGQLWKMAPEEPGRPSLDARSLELRLAETMAEIPDTPGERRFTTADHRAAAADRNGSLYWIADGRDRLLVSSVGSQLISSFWPRSEPRPHADRIFADRQDPVLEPIKLRSIAVTTDDYLIAAVAQGTGTELLRFDLVGGGPPEHYPLPAGIAVDDLAAGCCGALWILDETAKRLVLVDRDMRLASRDVDGDVSTFAPDGEEPSACPRDEPVAVSTSTVPVPSALAALPDGSIVLLDAPTDAPAGIFILEPDATELRLLLRLDFATFCLAVDSSDKDPALILGDPGGNRARRLKLEFSGSHWAAAASMDTLPLRRFGGRALVPIGGAVHYDSGPEPLWVRVIELPHRAFAAQATFLTPIFDSKEPQCVWDRLRLDACIPGGGAIVLEARASDDQALLAGSIKLGWSSQPPLYLSPEGSELQGRPAPTIAQADSAAVKGCWEVLLQGIAGRYCQLRLTLNGDGRISPHIRALRLWYPRFSYVERFLPAVYRAEAPPGSFLDRFLANFEGIATALEDRIATAETLFDPRTVPAEMIDWLASWFDIAIDARWDEQRRRLFLANAAQYFARRGTARALQLALKLALSEQIEAGDFALDLPKAVRPGGIQIVESFRRMPILRRFSPFAVGTAATPGEHGLDSLWSPEEGSAGLWARFSPGAPKSDPFPLFADADAAHWASFCQLQFGFVPGAGARERERWAAFQGSLGVTPVGVPGAAMDDADRARWDTYLGLRSYERTLWQDFLSLRYRSIDRLRAAWAEDWNRFTDIPLPDHVPASEKAVRDWLIFEGQRLPMEAGAHRFSVLLPRSRVDVSLEEEADLMARARHVVELEKPAHTRFDIRFYWAMNRIGEARLGVDTEIGQGSRAPELVPSAILGRAFVGAAFVGRPGAPPRGRRILTC